MSVFGRISGAIGKAALGTAGGPLGWIAVAWEKRMLILGLAGWILIAPAWLHGCSTGVQQEKDRVAASKLEAARVNAKANETAAAQRLEDELEVAANETEAKNAISEAIDSGVSDADLALNCQRLRRRGVTGISECKRFEAGSQAPDNRGDAP